MSLNGVPSSVMKDIEFCQRNWMICPHIEFGVSLHMQLPLNIRPAIMEHPLQVSCHTGNCVYLCSFVLIFFLKKKRAGKRNKIINVHLSDNIYVSFLECKSNLRNFVLIQIYKIHSCYQKLLIYDIILNVLIMNFLQEL